MGEAPAGSDPARSARPARWPALVLGLVAVTLLLVAVVALDVARVRASAFAARQALQDGLAAMEAGEVQVVTERLAAVDRHVAAAAEGTTRPGWRLVRRLPVADRNLATAEVAIDTAAAATHVATRIVEPVSDLTRPDGSTRIRDDEGRIDFRPVATAAARLADLDLAPLDDALRRLEGTPQEGLHPTVADGRDQALAQGRQLRDVGFDVRRMAGVLPDFLGTEEPREYFLAMQNVAEGRGTGGLIGFFATVRVGEGQIELTRPERYEVLDQVVAQGPAPPIATETLPAGFLDRYGQFDPTTFLANANLDPDFPTVAGILLNLYEEQRGRRLDGVIAMDPIALAYAHVAIGPVELPDEVFTGGLPRSIPPAALAGVLMVDAYDVLGGPSDERKAYLAAVAETAFRGVTSGRWGALAMTRWLAIAADRGHLQLFSAEPGEQAVFEDLDLTGSLAVPEGHDLLAVTHNNSGGNKMDVHVGHTIAGELWLDPTGDDGLRRRADLRVTVDNPLPTSGRDIYIIGTHKPNQGFVEFFTDVTGLNRTWFTVWVPDSAGDVAVTDADGEPVGAPRQHRLRGMLAVDHVLETPSQEQRSFAISLSGPVPTEVTADGARDYRLVLPRQSKGIADRIDLRLRAPEGWWIEVVDLEAGSQDTPTFGVHGEPGPPVTAEAGEEGIHLAGDRTRDVVLHVRLVPDEE